MTTGRVAVALALVLAAHAARAEGGDPGPHPTFRGRPLVAVLDELQDQGLNLIFSSAVVGPRLVVVEEPTSSNPRTLLDQLLAPLGLRARDTTSGAILIVSAPPPAPTEANPAAGDGPLASGPRLVEDIVVTPGRHTIVPEALGANRSLDRDQVVVSPTLGNDPSRMVTLLPGIASSEASATFNPRGSAAKDVSLILDGLELYDPYHLSTLQSPFSFVDGRMIDAIDFTGGGFTADRGDRHGGFLEMSSIEPAVAGSTELEAGTLNSRVAHASSTPFGPLVATGRYWYPDAAADTTAFGREGLHPKLADLYVKLGLKSAPGTTVSGHALLASDRATLSEVDGSETVAVSSGSGYLWFRMSQEWSPAVAVDSVFSAGRIDRQREGIGEPDDELVEVRDRRTVDFVGVKSDATWAVGGSHVFRGGIDTHLLRADLAHAAGPVGETSTVELDQAGASIAAYVAYRVAMTDRFIAEAGVRWDRQTYTGDRQWSPRLNLVWRAGTRSELRLGAGSYAQSLRIHELRIEDGETAYRPPENAKQLDFTFVHRFSKSWSLRIDGYHHRLSDLQPRYENQFHPLELFPEVEPDRVLIEAAGAKLQGLEVSVRGESGAPLHWMVNYTWSEAVDRIAGVDVSRSWDQTHAGNVLVAYGWRSGWFLSANGIVHTGWPMTPVTGRAVTLPDGSTEIEAVLGPRNSARLPTYARLDLKTGRTIATGKGSVRVELSIANVTDRQNVCCVDEVQFREGPDGRIETLTAYDTWMGITPTLQVLWAF